MTRALRLAAATPLLVAGMSVGGAAVVPALAPSAAGLCSAATYAHRLALVVEHGNGGLLRVCIGFDGASITGEQALQASGIQYAVAGYGSLGDAVCQIDREPATYPPSCWTTSSPYWVLFVAHAGGAWAPASRGVSSQTLGDGDAEGFRYDPQSGPDPPPASPAGTCAQATATSAPANAAAPPTAATQQQPQATTQPAAGSTAAATATPAASAVSGVVGAVQRAGARPSAASVDVALILAAAGGGALAGLLCLQLVRRRRRT